MVHLVLSSTKGNQGQRYFPYAGYLGLTPIRIDGIVRTKLDADQKRLAARAITISVRCYESRIGRVHALQSNVLFDHTHTLWAKPDGADYDAIGSLEFPFRFSLPARIPGFSTAVFVDYRCLWRIEAVLHHAPIAGVGSRQIRHFELPLVRYDLPAFPPALAPAAPVLDRQTAKRGAPTIRYSVNAPKNPIGPLDLVSIPIHLQPIDHGVSIRSASVIVERRIILHDIPTPATPQLPNSTDQDLSSQPASSSSTLSLGSSVPTITPNSIFPSTPSLATSTTPLIAPPPPPPTASAKVIVNPIAGAESSGSFSRDPRGMWSKTLTLQWPAPKSHSRWAIGETINSELVSVKYVVRTKIIVTSLSGTETVELADEELLIVSTNEAERQLALAKYNEALEGIDAAAATSSRSKSKSPRRSRPPEASGSNIPPSPALVQSPPAPVPASSPRSKPSTPRRPHTSAGPRDRPVDFGGGTYGRASVAGPSASASTSGTTSDGASRKRTTARVQVRPETSHSGASSGGSLMSGRNSASFWSTVHSNGVARRKEKEAKGGGRASASASTSSASGSVSSLSSRSRSVRVREEGDSSSSAAEMSDHMREWEAELARIEVRSRRSSDLLGFAGKKARVGGAALSKIQAIPVPPVILGASDMDI